MNRLDPGFRPANELFEGVRSSPRRRRREAVLRESRFPIPGIFLNQVQVGIRIAFGESPNLLVSAVDILLGIRLPPG